MIVSELLLQTQNQISLLRELVKSHGEDLKNYPTGKHAIQSRVTIEHCYNTLSRLNELLVKPIQADEKE